MASAQQDTSAETTPQEAGGPIVVFDDVGIAFEGKPVLEHITFKVERGETRVILGPAGGGKSVLLKLANGLLRPDSGSITVFGQRVDTMPERDLYKLRDRIGMVFQESALFDSLDVEDNIAYRLNEEGVAPAESRKRVEEVLNFVELPKAIDKYPSELSGGMRRRVSIARAIITGPDLILYDSPTGGLDPDHLDYHHRARRQTAGRLAHHVPAHHASPAGCVHPGDSSLQPANQPHGADTQERSRRHRAKHTVPGSQRGKGSL